MVKSVIGKLNRKLDGGKRMEQVDDCSNYGTVFLQILLHSSLFSPVFIFVLWQLMQVAKKKKEIVRNV